MCQSETSATSPTASRSSPGITATSFVLSLGPSLLSNLLNVSSPLVAGGMACAMFLAATGVQFTVSRVPVRGILLLGSGATLAAMASLIIAVNAALPAILILSALLAGIGLSAGTTLFTAVLAAAAITGGILVRRDLSPH
ncbi:MULTISPECIES: hypothetical protein [unclassified Cryobacterium]|uniref:hypothetical protein n=1 Tax=unclassified Cryobacterium TaxID=2649013 RepID=UPI001E535A81|nr:MULTISPECIES: hypothetical protein [unclassified Cryobacterium]